MTTNCCVIFRELFHFILFKVELLLEIEESLPKWILRRVQVDKHEEFPNRSSKLQTKVRKLQNCLERKLVNREMFVMVCLLMPVYIIHLFVYLFGFFQIYEKLIGFGKAESMGDDDGVPPALAPIIDKVLEQDSKYSELFPLLH